MSEIKGYLLTKEEEEGCVNLVKKLREKKIFAIDFSGYIKVKAKTREEAYDLFWEWVGALQDVTLADWDDEIMQLPYFENEGVEEQ